MSARAPRPVEGDPGKHARFRRSASDPTSTIEVLLRPHASRENTWEVYADNGDLTYSWVGTVGRYVGHLSWSANPRRPGNRVDGKRRTLWTALPSHDNARTMTGRESRADAIRSLLP